MNKVSPWQMGLDAGELLLAPGVAGVESTTAKIVATPDVQDIVDGTE
jgi:hypothetical protein